MQITSYALYALRQEAGSTHVLATGPVGMRHDWMSHLHYGSVPVADKLGRLLAEAALQALQQQGANLPEQMNIACEPFYGLPNASQGLSTAVSKTLAQRTQRQLVRTGLRLNMPFRADLDDLRPLDQAASLEKHTLTPSQPSTGTLLLICQWMPQSVRLEWYTQTIKAQGYKQLYILALAQAQQPKHAQAMYRSLADWEVNSLGGYEKLVQREPVKLTLAAVRRLLLATPLRELEAFLKRMPLAYLDAVHKAGMKELYPYETACRNALMLVQATRHTVAQKLTK